MPTIVEEIEKTETSEEKKGLLLDSLEIKGYRCFEHLTIEKLGRVNLIVGKNNVGKTTLLEAIEIFGSNLPDSDQFISRRNEIQQDSFSNINNLRKGGFNNLIFQKEDKPKGNADYFQIGQKNSLISFYLDFLIQGEEEFNLLANDRSPSEPNELDSKTLLFIPSTGVLDKMLTRLWDSIIFSEKETEIIRALQLISPTIERIAFINYPGSFEKRIAVVKTENSNFPVSIGRLGEGMVRLLGIALALVNCKDGILLIDEIEIGLHYSVLPDVWKLIFKTAKDLNVQVFATTHSKDCIEAFAQAAYNSPEEGMLIRLERHDEKIVAKTIEEEMLVDAVNYEVEVR